MILLDRLEIIGCDDGCCYHGCIKQLWVVSYNHVYSPGFYQMCFKSLNRLSDTYPTYDISATT